MESSKEPRLELAKTVLPKPLYEAIAHVFEQNLTDCVLVGGTCLSGFYAGHRRSDDMDLFTKSDIAFRSALLAIKSLKNIGLAFLSESKSSQLFHATCKLKNHHFTIDLVLDENLFKVGKLITLENGIVVADLTTILRMKVATLVSRCGEKDLFDLSWMCSHAFSALSLKELIDLGSTIDGGVNAENILASVAGTILREDACDFSIDLQYSKSFIFEEVKKFQKLLIKEFSHYLRHQPTHPLGELVKQLKKLVK